MDGFGEFTSDGLEGFGSPTTGAGRPSNAALTPSAHTDNDFFFPDATVAPPPPKPTGADAGADADADDPTADFLRREQAALGDDAALFGNAGFSDLGSPAAAGSLSASAARPPAGPGGMTPVSATAARPATASGSIGGGGGSVGSGGGGGGPASASVAGSLPSPSARAAAAAPDFAMPAGGFGVHATAERSSADFGDFPPAASDAAAAASAAFVTDADLPQFPPVQLPGQAPEAYQPPRLDGLGDGFDGFGASEGPGGVSAEASEAIERWRTAFEARVAERDAAAAEKHARRLADAQAALDAFYAEYNAKKAKTVAKNKETERAAAAAREAETSGQDGGNVWEGAVKLIESVGTTAAAASAGGKAGAKAKGLTSPSSAAGTPSGARPSTATAPKTSRDTQRFRSMLYALRKDPNAPGVRAST
ncbi:hypothetical protein CXG81DRAFT_17953 [Caulochytrium protostelioides]|uniref:Clathrin light chain n=1 Tax=Caulochytrium protostelioides TaxID=1555241 RepID=A0A4P9XAH5_9FUNG|nr:hypothetical protein CXG81DRAFT_17953 [Caulochytrium protostelioides]|eukprot:RKP02358.1 hypothetical protein CXG81DRAFT_17953 [Caulochytrium protostelioides]